MTNDEHGRTPEWDSICNQAATITTDKVAITEAKRPRTRSATAMEPSGQRMPPIDGRKPLNEEQPKSMPFLPREDDAVIANWLPH